MKFEPVIKWSGSKRDLSEEIVKHIPETIDTYYEPFCGGCSVAFQLMLSEKKINKYVLSDVNEDLIAFFKLVKNYPLGISVEYSNRWHKLNSYSEITDKQKYYNEVRDNYNSNKNPYDFIFLTRTCVNGLIRYNKSGNFNSPFHLTRNGMKPETFNKILYTWNVTLNRYKVEFVNQEYKSIKPEKNDFVFLDPPYANTKGMYYGVIDFNYFWQWLRETKCKYILTFDGKRTDKDNTYSVPEDVYNQHIYLDKKISGFKKLHKDTEYVSESLYIKNILPYTQSSSPN